MGKLQRNCSFPPEVQRHETTLSLYLYSIFSKEAVYIKQKMKPLGKKVYLISQSYCIRIQMSYFQQCCSLPERHKSQRETGKQGPLKGKTKSTETVPEEELMDISNKDFF